MPYRKGYSYSKRKRFCENKMKVKKELLLNKENIEKVNFYDVLIYRGG